MVLRHENVQLIRCRYAIIANIVTISSHFCFSDFVTFLSEWEWQEGDLAVFDDAAFYR